MAAIKIYYGVTVNNVFNKFTLDTISPEELILIVGDKDTKTIQFYFDHITSANSTDYECRLLIERPDGSTSNDLFVSNMGDYYQITLGAWATEQYGEIKLSPKLKELVGGEYITETYGVATLNVSYGVVIGEETICLTQEQYDAVLSAITIVDNKTVVNKADIILILADLETRLLKSGANADANITINGVTFNLTRATNAIQGAEYDADVTATTTGLKDRTTLLESEVDAIEADIGNYDNTQQTIAQTLTNHGGRITQTEADITDHESRIVVNEGQLAVLLGAVVPRGRITETTVAITADLMLLTLFINNMFDRQPAVGDMLKDSDGNEWVFYDTEWVFMGQSYIQTAIANVRDGLISKEDQKRLDDIETAAQVNIIEEVKVNDVALSPTAKSVNVPLAVPTGVGEKAGVISAADKTKLDSLTKVHNELDGITTDDAHPISAITGLLTELTTRYTKAEVDALLGDMDVSILIETLESVTVNDSGADYVGFDNTESLGVNVGTALRTLKTQLQNLVNSTGWGDIPDNHITLPKLSQEVQNLLDQLDLYSVETQSNVTVPFSAETITAPIKYRMLGRNQFGNKSLPHAVVSRDSTEAELSRVYVPELRAQSTVESDPIESSLAQIISQETGDNLTINYTHQVRENDVIFFSLNWTNFGGNTTSGSLFVTDWTTLNMSLTVRTDITPQPDEYFRTANKTGIATTSFAFSGDNATFVRNNVQFANLTLLKELGLIEGTTTAELIADYKLTTKASWEATDFGDVPGAYIADELELVQDGVKLVRNLDENFEAIDPIVSFIQIPPIIGYSAGSLVRLPHHKVETQATTNGAVYVDRNDLPISSVLKIRKQTANGLVGIDHALAEVSGTNLFFTHPNIANGDTIIFEYAYTADFTPAWLFERHALNVAGAVKINAEEIKTAKDSIGRIKTRLNTKIDGKIFENGTQIGLITSFTIIDGHLAIQYESEE